VPDVREPDGDPWEMTGRLEDVCDNAKVDVETDDDRELILAGEAES
jgi:hypothetical protein